MESRMPVPSDPEQLIVRRIEGSGPATGIEALPDEATICSCNNVSKGTIRRHIVEKSLADIGAVKACTKAGTSCGGCATLVSDLLRLELRKAGVETPAGICEHFSLSRQEIFDLLRVEGIQSFGEFLQRYGKGHGCEGCQPA